jgi:hypothetical protein
MGFPAINLVSAKASIEYRARNPVKALNYHGKHIFHYTEEADAVQKSKRKIKRPSLPHLPGFSKRRRRPKDELGVVSLVEDDEAANDVEPMRSRVHAKSVLVSLAPPTSPAGGLSLTKRFSQLFGFSIGVRVGRNGDRDMGSSRLTAGEAADSRDFLKLLIKRRRVF